MRVVVGCCDDLFMLFHSHVKTVRGVRLETKLLKSTITSRYLWEM